MFMIIMALLIPVILSILQFIFGDKQDKNDAFDEFFIWLTIIFGVIIVYYTGGDIRNLP